MKQILPILIIGILFISCFIVIALPETRSERHLNFNISENENLVTTSPNNRIKYSIYFSEISFSKHKIDTNIDFSSVFTCDLDNDNDEDIIATSAIDSCVIWWRNDGGYPITWTEQTIDDNFDGAAYTYACDIDNDYDIDVLGAAWYGNEIAYWSNDGGDPIIWTKQTVKTGYSNAHEVYACDLDNDGDNDVLGASAGLNEITWWQNNGGSPITWIEQTISNECYGARSVFVCDLDSDNYCDTLGSAFTSNEITWYQNNGGNPIQWTRYDIDSSFNGAHHVSTYDIDSDGDFDVIGAAAIGNEVAWWRNDGGDPIIWNKEIIDDNFRGALKISVADLDNDSDVDIIGTATNSNRVSWWCNDGGNPIIWSKKTIDSMCAGAWPLYVSDIDGDGDIDVIAGGNTGISWYENNLYAPSKLECIGSLSWSNVKPGSTVEGSFSVKNVGESNSLLDWKISEYPDWGTWTFNPENGKGITPETGSIIVEVNVIAPDEKQIYKGNITVINEGAISNFEIINVSLSTPKNKSIFNTTLLNLLEDHPRLFQIFRQLLRL